MKSKFSKLQNFLKVFDIFGVTLSFTYASQQNYRTIFGSFFTILLMCIFVYKFVISLQDLILNRNLTVKMEEIPINDDKIELTNLNMMICNNYNLFYKDNSYDDYYTYKYAYYDEEDNYTVTRFERSQCKEMHLDEDMMHFKDYCVCMKFNDTNYSTVKKSPKLLQDNYSQLGFQMNYTFIDQILQNSTEFDPYLLQDMTQFSIIYQKNYVNTTDYNQPLQNSQSFYFKNFKRGSFFEDYVTVDKLEINIINDVYTFGLVKPDIKTSTSYSFNFFTGTVWEMPDKNMSVYSIMFKHSELVKNYSIQSFNLESFLALFGGYFQVFFVLFQIISIFFNEFSFKKHIQMKFIKNVKMINKLVEEIDNFANSNNRNNPHLNNNFHKNEFYLKDTPNDFNLNHTPNNFNPAEGLNINIHNNVDNIANDSYNLGIYKENNPDNSSVENNSNNCFNKNNINYSSDSNNNLNRNNYQLPYGKSISEDEEIKNEKINLIHNKINNSKNNNTSFTVNNDLKSPTPNHSILKYNNLQNKSNFNDDTKIYNEENNFNIEMVKPSPGLKANKNNYLDRKNKKKDPNKYSDELVEDFLNQLDFEKIYLLIKEVKLMKFFLFDCENLSALNKLLNIPFNVDNFEIFIRDRSNLFDREYNHNKNNNFNQNSFKDKLKIIKEIFVTTY